MSGARHWFPPRDIGVELPVSDVCDGVEFVAETEEND